MLHDRNCQELVALKKTKTVDLAYIALAVALTAVCAWIQVPMTIPFTLQTFAVVTVAGLLGPWRGVIAMVVYMLLGMAGVPVFSGFRSGAGVLFSATGGYIIGFVFTALVTGLFIQKFGRSILSLVLSMVAGLAFCYLFGTLWFCYVYAAGTGFGAALMLCVVPYLLPEAVKIALAVLVVRRVGPHLKH